MLDGFAAHTRGLRVLIEPRLRGFDDVFVFPAFDAALVGRCALILEQFAALGLGRTAHRSVECVVTPAQPRQPYVPSFLVSRVESGTGQQLIGKSLV
jgi:hypothetical protein